MKKLYLDCDGVILDTINKGYSKIKGALTDEEKSIFFKNLDWDEFIIESGEIDNAIEKIKILCNYFDVAILTHVNSEKEAISKIKYFSISLPDVKVLTVPKEIKKADFVSPDGAILVDDYMPNLEYWYQMGGVPVKFSSTNKECKFMKVTNLLELLDLPLEGKRKARDVLNETYEC